MNDVAAAAIAHGRSLEAELATEHVGQQPTGPANAHAAQLHTEAALWRTQTGDTRRALRHEAYARVHSSLAVRLQPDGEEAT